MPCTWKPLPRNNEAYNVIAHLVGHVPRSVLPNTVHSTGTARVAVTSDVGRSFKLLNNLRIRECIQRNGGVDSPENKLG